MAMIPQTLPPLAQVLWLVKAHMFLSRAKHVKWMTRHHSCGSDTGGNPRE
jgi:hypothetical protein